MTNKNLVIALSVVALALISTIATATYASNIMSPQRNGTNYQMSEEQCETIMESIHNSEQNSSMMSGSDHGGMMGSGGMSMSGMDGANGMGSSSGCH